MQAPDSHWNSTSQFADAGFAFVKGEVHLLESFLTPDQADEAFAALRTELPWSQHQVRMFGRVLNAPRLSSWHGDPEASYRYSGTRYLPQPWTPTLKRLQETLLAATHSPFNSVLCNRYRSGADSMGWHADDEPELGAQPLIASISLGATRRFDLKPRKHKAPPLRIDLAHGSLLLMSGDTQRNWLHQLPKTSKPVGERINLTYRLILVR